MMTNDIQNILWTGGWDSTFQLLFSVIVLKEKVQPHYLIDVGRKSTLVEMRVMEKIKEKLFVAFPDTKQLLLSTRYASVKDIDNDPEVSAAFKSIRQETFVGEQYVWLSSYCKAHDIENMQLCIHRDDKAYDVVGDFVRVSSETESVKRYSIPAEVPSDTLAKKVFGCFVFPILDLTKLEMQTLANQHHFSELMEFTWFCHKPTSRNQPCGICNPCLYTIEEGMERRVPANRRLVSLVYRNSVLPFKSEIKRIINRIK